MASAVEIESVIALEGRVPGLDCGLAAPEAGQASSELGIEIKGWARSAGPPVEAVELVCAGEVLREGPLELGRHADSETSAGAVPDRFFITLSALRLPPRFALEVRARLEDGSTAPVAEIVGRRETLASGAPRAGLRGAFISTPTGRTGTTWIVHLLGHHPEVVAYPPHGVEPRVASYWLEVLAALSEPGSYKRMLRPHLGRERWWLGEWPEAGRQPVHDEWARGFLGRDRTLALAAHVREQIDGFYRGLAEQQGKDAARAFVEKAPMGRVRSDVLDDLLGGTSEVTLFRDPRDTICSILSYAERNPRANLVSERPDTSDEYLERVAASFRGLLAEARARPGASLVVRYEDLIGSPDVTLETILEHLDLDTGQGTIADTLASAWEAADRLSGHRTATGSVDQSIGRWRRDMEPTLQIRTTSIFADTLEELGYLDDERPAPRPRGAGGRDREPLRGLLRTIDYAGWRHVYAVDEAPDAAAPGGPTSELGGLLASAGEDRVALVARPDGLIETTEHEPAPPRPSVIERLRWATAPLGWHTEAGVATRGRTAVGRARRLLSRPWQRGRAGEPRTLGYLHASRAGGRRPLFSSVHPITGDQLLTARPKEARDLGYPEPERLGFIEIAAPATGDLAPRRGFVPWAHRYGAWRSPGRGASQGAIFEPAGGPVPRDALRVRGWAVLRGEPVARVEVRVDGTPVGRARLGLQRPKVADAPNPEMVISGFDLRVPPSALPAGLRRAQIEAVAIGIRDGRLELEVAGPVELTDPATTVSEERLRVVAERAADEPAGGSAASGHQAGSALGIVAFAHSLAPGGAQRTLYEQIERLTASGAFEAAVVSGRRGPWAERFERIETPVHIAGRPEDASADAYEEAVAELTEVLELESPDVVLANTVDSFAGADAATRLGIPVAWIIHESYEFPVWWQMGHPEPEQAHARERCLTALFSAAATIFPAEATRALYEPYVRAERSLAVPCGVEFAEIDRYRAEVEPATARRRLGLDPEARVLLALGIVEPRKGNAVLARAWREVAPRHPDTRLHMVGVRDTPYCEALRRYVDAAGIADSCRLEPPTMDPMDWHAAADLFVLSSDVESAPIALAEAMAFGTPALATRVFGVPELITDGLDGVLFEPNDVADLAGTLDAVLGMDPDHLHAIGARGAARAREHHDPDRFLEGLSEVLRSIANERDPAPA